MKAKNVFIGISDNEFFTKNIFKLIEAKNLRFLAIALFVSAIGFAMLSCDNDAGGDGSGGLPAPANVRAARSSSNPTDVSITWNAVSGASSYKVYYSSSSTGSGTLDGTSTTTSFTSRNCAENRAWYFMVVAVNGSGVEGTRSARVSVGATGSSNGGGSGSSAVTGVTVSPTSASITVGSTRTLTATVQPANATNKTVTWSSSNSAVASVSSGGVVTGVSAGTATITVRTADGGRTATSTVTVTGGQTNSLSLVGTNWTPINAVSTDGIWSFVSATEFRFGTATRLTGRGTYRIQGNMIYLTLTWNTSGNVNWADWNIFRFINNNNLEYGDVVLVKTNTVVPTNEASPGIVHGVTPNCCQLWQNQYNTAKAQYDAAQAAYNTYQRLYNSATTLVNQMTYLGYMQGEQTKMNNAQQDMTRIQNQARNAGCRVPS